MDHQQRASTRESSSWDQGQFGPAVPVGVAPTAGGDAGADLGPTAGATPEAAAVLSYWAEEGTAAPDTLSPSMIVAAAPAASGDAGPAVEAAATPGISISNTCKLLRFLSQSWAASTPLYDVFCHIATNHPKAYDHIRTEQDTRRRRDLTLLFRAAEGPCLDRLRGRTNSPEIQAKLSKLPKVDQEKANKQVLAAFQLQVVADAESEWAGDNSYKDDGSQETADERKARIIKEGRATGLKGISSNWCGAFVAAQYGKSGLHPRLMSGFGSTKKLQAFFTYVDPNDASWYPSKVKVDGEPKPMKVKDYHAARNSTRQWRKVQTEADFSDLQPGDICIIDNGTSLTEEMDHINMVQSYNPDTGELITIDGNATGVVPGNSASSTTAEKKIGESLSGTDPANETKVKESTQATVSMSLRNARDNGRRNARIYAWGRPSLVDLEPQEYK